MPELFLSRKLLRTLVPMAGAAALVLSLAACKSSTPKDGDAQGPPPKKSSFWSGLNDSLDWPKTKTPNTDSEYKKKIFALTPEEEELLKNTGKSLDPSASEDKKKSSVFSF